MAPRSPRDEREQLIALRANRAGFYALEIGAFFALVTFFWWSDPAVIANGVFLPSSSPKPCVQPSKS